MGILEGGNYGLIQGTNNVISLFLSFGSHVLMLTFVFSGVLSWKQYGHLHSSKHLVYAELLPKTRRKGIARWWKGTFWSFFHSLSSLLFLFSLPSPPLLSSPLLHFLLLSFYKWKSFLEVPRRISILPHWPGLGHITTLATEI